MAVLFRGNEVNEKARKHLLDNVINGVWNDAMGIYKETPWLRLEKITIHGDTALHLAVQDGHEMVVKEMVKSLTTDERYELGVLKSTNDKGNTPLHLAASIGSVSMCECLVSRSNWKDLLSIRNENGENPIFLAARHGKIEAFLFLQCRASESDILRNNKGETILHCAIAGGHFQLASRIIEKYENLGITFDQAGVSPLLLLANQPTAFRSGDRLGPIDKIIYHYISVFPPSSGDHAATSDHPVPWYNIKGLLFFIVTFIKICTNPSNGAKPKNFRMDLDEEDGVAPHHQGIRERNNEIIGKGKRNFPMNYDTCCNFIVLLVKAIWRIAFSGIGRSYVDKLREKKQKHISSAKILEKIIKLVGDNWYDITGENPLYKNRSLVLYEDRETWWLDAPTPDNLKKGTGGESFKEKGRDTITGTPPFLVAATNGITEMVEKILQTHPAAIHELDSAKKNVLLLAVENRRFDVVKLLRLKYKKIKSTFRAVDQDRNNVLHLAARCKPGYWIGIPEGFQMHMEIRTFEYVKDLVAEHDLIVSGTNNANESPADVFTATHEELLENNKKWLKETSGQCSALAGIIASITFATSTSSIPTDSIKGRHSFEISQDAGFTVYAISSLVALSFSITSAVVFLTIANSSYRERDFHSNVPGMLFFGFLTLFISIGATLTSFCGAHIFTIAYKLNYASIPLYMLVFLPLILFSLAQIRSSYLRLSLATFKVDNNGENNQK